MNAPTQAALRGSVRGAGGVAQAVPPAGRRRDRGPWLAWAFLAPVTAYLVACYAYPLYRNLDLSLRHYTVRSFVQGDAPFTGWRNFSTVLHDPTFGPAMRHTMVFTLVSIVFQYAAGLALAVFFNRH